MLGNKRVVNVIWLLAISVHIKRGFTFRALRFVVRMVIQTEDAQFAKFPDYIAMVPPAVPLIPTYVAVEITNQGHIHALEHGSMLLQVFPHLTNVGKRGRVGRFCPDCHQSQVVVQRARNEALKRSRVQI